MHLDLTLIRHFVDARWLIEISVFVQVVLIDLVMAGDNALAVGIAASNLPADKRKMAILLGLLGGVVVRVLFVLITIQLFQVVGLVLAGGLLLLWVARRMWRDLRHQDRLAHAEHQLSAATGVDIAPKGSKAPPTSRKAHRITLASAAVQILVADVSMSLDNILAVTGAARQHIFVLMFGLLFSIVAIGVAAGLIAKVLNRVRWLGYVGVLIVSIVACRMIYDGSMQFWVVEQCDQTLKCVPDTLERTLDWWRHCPDHFQHFLQRRHF